ncbi:MAG: NAD-dependent succinate-semialdehyde dehydrogenase [Bdellovibrionales bacterium]
MSFTTINPKNGKAMHVYELDDHHQMEEKLNLCHQSFQNWRARSVEDRCQLMQNLKTTLEKHTPEWARLITDEMGKPIVESRAELKKCAQMIQFYAENGVEFLQDEPIKTQYQKSYITYQPQGLIFGIMPWNFPFWQVLRFAVPALITGNVVVVKHAPNVLGCLHAIQSLFREDGFPDYVYESLVIEVETVEKVVADPRVRGVSFTGSEAAGRSVGELAGRHLKKVVLELGGSDAYLVLSNANVEHAARSCVASRFINAGQSCVAAKRWIVHKNVKDEFVQKVKGFVAEFKLGDPRDEETRLGPLARQDLRDKVADQVRRSIQGGATVVVGGEGIEVPGSCYYPVTVLEGVEPGQPAFDEELFGPVAAIITVDSDERAIELANQSEYGLGGAVFTENLTQGEDIARTHMDTGGVFVNDFYRSMPALPFGGVKASGMGRELSHHAMYEFANMKVVVVNDV